MMIILEIKVDGFKNFYKKESETWPQPGQARLGANNFNPTEDLNEYYDQRRI